MSQIKYFENWFRFATKAQRVHQESVDELNAESIIVDARLQGYVLSKDLQKARNLDVTPTPTPQGPSAPGIGGSRSNTRRRSSMTDLDAMNKLKGPKSKKEE